MADTVNTATPVTSAAVDWARANAPPSTPASRYRRGSRPSREAPARLRSAPRSLGEKSARKDSRTSQTEKLIAAAAMPSWRRWLSSPFRRACTGTTRPTATAATTAGEPPRGTEGRGGDDPTRVVRWECSCRNSSRRAAAGQGPVDPAADGRSGPACGGPEAGVSQKSVRAEVRTRVRMRRSPYARCRRGPTVPWGASPGHAGPCRPKRAGQGAGPRRAARAGRASARPAPARARRVASGQADRAAHGFGDLPYDRVRAAGAHEVRTGRGLLQREHVKLGQVVHVHGAPVLITGTDHGERRGVSGGSRTGGDEVQQTAAVAVHRR